MVGNIQTGFEAESVTIKVRDILPLKKVPASVRKGRKYRQITAAIQEIGIVQPPIVTRHPKLPDKFLLLEGHLRIEVLKDLGIEEVTCLISNDDEAFTYNRQVNRLATIQEHRMILKLVERGVSEERIAEALDVNVPSIRARLNLLHGICPEAAELLKDKQCPIDTIRALKKMKPVRQVDAVDMMIEMNNFNNSLRQGPGGIDAAGTTGRHGCSEGSQGGLRRADCANGARNGEPSTRHQAHRSDLRP